MSADLVADHLRAEIDWQIAHPPEWWDPGEGGELCGVLTGWCSSSNRYNDTFKVAMVRDRSGETFKVALLWTVLRSEFAGVDPQLDETIMIRRLNDRENVEGNKYRDYELAVYREGDLTAFSHEPQPIPPSRDWTIIEGGYTQ